MKIIDLLNKIAKGEEVPKKIQYRNYVFEYYERLNDTCNYKVIGSDSKYLNDIFFIDNILNDEVEIIEEEKDIEKIIGIDTRETRDCIIKFQEKFNELIDVINDMRDKE